MRLQDSIVKIKGIGEKTAAAFAKVGVSTVEDLLRYYPRGYETYGEPVGLLEAVEGQKCAVRGVVLFLSAVKRYTRYQVFTAQVYAKIINHKKDEAVNLVNGLFG